MFGLSLSAKAFEQLEMHDPSEVSDVLLRKTLLHQTDLNNVETASQKASASIDACFTETEKSLFMTFIKSQ